MPQVIIFRYEYIADFLMIVPLKKKDYTNYALLWTCVDLIGNQSREEGAILGKRRNLTEAVYRKVDSLLEEVNLSRENFRFIKHDEES